MLKPINLIDYPGYLGEWASCHAKGKTPGHSTSTWLDVTTLVRGFFLLIFLEERSDRILKRCFQHAIPHRKIYLLKLLCKADSWKDKC